MTSFFNTLPKIKYDVPSDARAMLVLIHGMAEHSGRYAEIVQLLNANAIACCSFDLRGHGLAPASEQERGDVVAFQDFVADSAAVIDDVRGRYPQLPLFVWGHSMGAIIATLTVAQVALAGIGKVRGAITSSPPIAAFDRVPLFALRVLQGLCYVIPRFRIALPFKPEQLSRDLQVGLRYGEDRLVPKAVTLRLLVQLTEASARCVQVARKIKLPWLALHGADDQIAPPIGSQRLIDALSSTDKYLRLWQGARHEVHNEIEPTRTEFLETMVAWIKEKSGPV
jgi:alpha-beta hydrolase superfamily lysophospholipase